MKPVLLAAGAFLAVCAPVQAQEIVTIRSDQFAQEIVTLKSAWEQVDREFQMRTDEMLGLAARIEKLTAEAEELQKRGALASDIGPKAEAVLRLRVEYAKKSNAYQEDRGRRTQQVVGPVAKKIENAMSDFLAARGVKEVFDLDAGEQAPPGAPDISKDFAAWFNARN